MRARQWLVYTIAAWGAGFLSTYEGWTDEVEVLIQTQMLTACYVLTVMAIAAAFHESDFNEWMQARRWEEEEDGDLVGDDERP
jgi:hypothetical protein